MTISEMTDDERHTFGAVLRTMVGADGSTSPEESAGLQAAAHELGADEFWGLIRETVGADYSADAIRTRAATVERQPVQETIYGVLFGLATAGSVLGEEAKLLDWLAATWNIKGSGPEGGPAAREAT